MTRTSDLQLAAFLLARGHPLIRTEQNGPRKLLFLIAAPESERQAYYGQDDLVSAKRLFESWRSLRGLIDAEGIRR
jgi:hypothetical protein